VKSTHILPFVAFLVLGATEGVHAQPLTQRYDFERRAERFDLPGRLDEVSGLGFTPDGRLFAHGDERARFHEVDVAQGTAGKRFSLGEPATYGDFEGMEIVGERFFLMASTGFLYETREGSENRDVVPYRAVDTGLGNRCEAEGLAYDASDGELLVACKTSTPPRAEAVIHRIPISSGQRRPDPIIIPTRQLEELGHGSEFHPSGIAVDPETGNLVLLSAREELVVEVDRGGNVVSVFQLSKDRHPQPEGIAFGPDGRLYVADEAAGRENSRITVYGRRPEASPDPGGGE